MTGNRRSGPTRVRRAVGVVALTGLLVAPSAAAGGAAGEGPGDALAFTDARGDANAVNDQGVGELPLGDHDSRPASFSSADLLEGWYETTYVSVGERDDDDRVVAVRRVPTGLRVHLRTVLPAVPTFGPTVALELPVEVDGCALTFRMWAHGPRSGADDPPQGAELEARSAACPGGPATYRDGVVADDGKTVTVLEFPFPALETADGPLLAPGDLLAAEAGVVARTVAVQGLPDGTVAYGPDIDRAAPIQPFVLGSDLPPDVDCLAAPADPECLGAAEKPSRVELDIEEPGWVEVTFSLAEQRHVDLEYRYTVVDRPMLLAGGMYQGYGDYYRMLGLWSTGWGPSDAERFVVNLGPVQMQESSESSRTAAGERFVAGFSFEYPAGTYTFLFPLAWHQTTKLEDISFVVGGDGVVVEEVRHGQGSALLLDDRDFDTIVHARDDGSGYNLVAGGERTLSLEHTATGFFFTVNWWIDQRGTSTLGVDGPRSCVPLVTTPGGVGYPGPGYQFRGAPPGDYTFRIHTHTAQGTAGNPSPPTVVLFMVDVPIPVQESVNPQHWEPPATGGSHGLATIREAYCQDNPL